MRTLYIAWYARHYRTKYLTSMGAFLVIGALYWSHVPSTVSWKGDGYLAPEYRNHCKLLYQQQPHLAAKPQELLKKIQEIIPIITALRLNFERWRHVSIELITERPIVRLSQESVLTRNNLRTPAAFYNQETIAQLPVISVQETEHTTHATEIINWLTILPRKIFDTYALVWKSKYHVELHTQNKPYRMISICSAQQPLDAQTCTALEILEHKLVQSVPAPARRRGMPTWYVDLRVPQYLIVSTATRGAL